MKKILSVLLIAVMVLSLNACGDNSNDNGNSGNVGKIVENPNIPEAVKTSKIFKALEVFDGDTYSYVIDFGVIEGATIRIYRKGNNIYSDLAGIKTYLVDDVYYELNPFGDTAEFSRLNQKEIAEQIEKVSNPYVSMVNLSGAQVLSSGKDIFGGIEREYEEVKTKSGEVVRAFFDGDMLAGLLSKQIESEGGNWIEIKFEVSDTVDDEVFVVPAHIQRVPK